MTGLRVAAPAKLNLSLRVRERDDTGLHPVSGFYLTVDRRDFLLMREAGRDGLRIIGDPDLPTGEDNLTWAAVRALRQATGADLPVEMELVKRIPAAAGLGGGSSDAAAALLAYQRLALPRTAAGPNLDLDEAAARVGADVPFCLHGGLRYVSGYGERLGEPLPPPDDFAVTAAVPPMKLATARVYKAWDLLDNAGGAKPRAGAAGRDLPPSLREYGPLGNDLYPAAVRCAPEVDDWRAELRARWGRPVLMSGSGPALFGLFADRGEAGEALALVPGEARGAFTAAPTARGAALEDDAEPDWTGAGGEGM